MISADEAARVARNAGLTIGDAASLRALADDVPEAERIAKRFAEPDEKAVVRDLFAAQDHGRGTGLFAQPNPDPDGDNAA